MLVRLSPGLRAGVISVVHAPAEGNELLSPHADLQRNNTISGERHDSLQDTGAVNGQILTWDRW